jgi:hypothetical protein
MKYTPETEKFQVNSGVFQNNFPGFFPFLRFQQGRPGIESRFWEFCPQKMAAAGVQGDKTPIWQMNCSYYTTGKQ